MSFCTCHNCKALIKSGPVIRIFDMSGGLGLDVAGAIAEKLAFNASRADHKVENRQAVVGKKF